MESNNVLLWLMSFVFFNLSSHFNATNSKLNFILHSDFNGLIQFDVLEFSCQATF